MWVKFKIFFFEIVTDFFVEFIIILCIVVNIVFMVMEYYGMSFIFEVMF